MAYYWHITVVDITDTIGTHVLGTLHLVINKFDSVIVFCWGCFTWVHL